MTHDILASGSSGNCVIINGEIAIDMGIPMKKLRESGYIKSLKLALLTHQHSDHFNATTVRALHKERPALRWGCCEWMVPHLLEAGVDKRVIDIYGAGGFVVYRGMNISICAKKTLHDVPNCCYLIVLPGDERLFYATDCATLDGIEAKGYDLYMLENNHGEAEIAARVAEKHARGEFAYETRAARYHMSQEKAMEFLFKNIPPERLNNTEIVFLHQHKE